MQINSLQSTVIVSDYLQKDIVSVLKKYAKSSLFVIVDENTEKHCLPLIREFERIREAKIISIASGDENKNLANVEKIWRFLSQNSADRNSLLINLGGGMLCDLGGFAASTFKRGIEFVDIPTTLLAQVDAVIGGKIGINFENLKNEIGLFKSPSHVIIDTIFLKTLDMPQMLSGFAEMIKHALIYSSNHWKKLKTYDFSQTIDYVDFKKSITKSIFIKNDYIQVDPKEKNSRKALNFGHTFGHAFESLYMNRNETLFHGHAVAFGMICELLLSCKKLGFDKLRAQEINSYILKTYGKLALQESDFDAIYELMTHDKKNERNQISFTLLSEIGEVEINTNCTKKMVYDAMDEFLQL